MELLDIVLIVLAAVVGLAIGIGMGMGIRKRFAEREIGSAEQEATRLINEAIPHRVRKRSKRTPRGTEQAGTPAAAEGRDPGQEVRNL